jgi:hypothetical protein
LRALDHIYQICNILLENKTGMSPERNPIAKTYWQVEAKMDAERNITHPVKTLHFFEKIFKQNL